MCVKKDKRPIGILALLKNAAHGLVNIDNNNKNDTRKKNYSHEAFK